MESFERWSESLNSTLRKQSHRDGLERGMSRVAIQLFERDICSKLLRIHSRLHAMLDMFAIFCVLVMILIKTQQKIVIPAALHSC